MTARGLPGFGAQKPHVDPHALALRILSDPRFRMQARRSGESWWTRFWSWVAARMDALFGHSIHPNPGLLQIVGDVLLIGAAGLVIYFIVRLLLNIRREEAQTGSASVRALARRVASKEWYGRALEAAGKGNYGVAAVLLFRAVLSILDLRGVVHDDPSRTVNESKAELRERAPQFMALFDAVERIFTAALYAESPVSQAQWEQARVAYEQLFSAVTHPA